MHLEELDESNCKNGVSAFEHCYEKCVNFDGDYAEK
jgi:hypothetical protein